MNVCSWNIPDFPVLVSLWCFFCSNIQYALFHMLKFVKRPEQDYIWRKKTCLGSRTIPVSFQVSQWSCLHDGADRLTDLTPLEIERLLQFSNSIPGSTRLFPLNRYKSDHVRIALIC